MKKELIEVLNSFKLDRYYKSLIYFSIILVSVASISNSGMIFNIPSKNLFYSLLITFVIGNLMWLIDESIKRLNISTIGKYKGRVPPGDLFHYQLLYTAIWITLNLILSIVWIYLLWRLNFSSN